MRDSENVGRRTERVRPSGCSIDEEQAVPPVPRSGHIAGRCLRRGRRALEAS